MLYADDLILLAESEEDFQSQMNSLGRYAVLFGMEKAQKKTKVLVFDKPVNVKKRTPKVWEIGKIRIEKDKSSKYLGAIFTND